MPRLVITLILIVTLAPTVLADDIKKTDLYRRIRISLDAVPAIDTHDHLRPFEDIPFRDVTDRGKGMTLHSIWRGSYYQQINPLTPWPEGKPFDAWWSKARHDFADARATSFYRYVLPAFSDLYGIDFETMTDDQARELDRRIFENDKSDKWLIEVITQRANIELMLIDPYWARFKFDRAYKFAVPILNVTSMVDGYHHSSFTSDLDSPYEFAKQQGKEVRSLDDYLSALDTIFQKAVASDAVCLKTTLAYQRTLDFQNVSRERAERAFGKPKSDLSPEQVKDFQDFILWRLCELSAKHELPFQIHSGHARIQGSNPMLLVDLIEANPKTKFILFHGGFPWVGETGAIAMRHKNVWVDSVWLPQISYTMARRAYQEWLEVMPANRIMWGADTTQAEGIYAATVWTRQCLSEALAEKVDRGELPEKDALRIGRQILRENALALFPKLKRQLWKDAAKTAP